MYHCQIQHKVQLANSKQKPEESIEDWADRVMQLSVRVFPDLREEYMYQQAVKRICHRCNDKSAGQYVVKSKFRFRRNGRRQNKNFSV